MGLKVLSLFDGMSCGQLALQKLGIEVDTYYASEIDKFAIQVTQANFPNTIQVGDVCKLKAEDYQDVDLILAGSPCQGFSFSGKQLAFDDPRSALFFEFIRLLKEIKPKYFLLENVRMKQEFQNVITEQVSACYPDYKDGDLFGSQIKPILINSALVSAQNRQRLYWTNIPNVEQPVDKNIVLKDILEDLPIENSLSPYMTKDFDGVNRLEKGIFSFTEKDKSAALTSGGGHPNKYLLHKEPTDASFIETKTSKKEYISKKSIEKYVENKNAEFNDPYNKKTIKGNKSTALRTNSSNGNMWVNEKAIKETKPKVVVQSYKEVRTDEAKAIRRLVKQQTGKDHTPFRAKKLQPREDGKVGTVTPSLNKDHVISIENEKLTWRKLTPLECERLQTVPDNYTNYVSNTQRFKMLGNGWTIDVIAHILKNMEL